MLRLRATDGALAAGLALLLVLFAAGVIGATRGVAHPAPIPVQMDRVSEPSLQRGGSLLLPGGAETEVVAHLRFTLTPPEAGRSRWVVWLPRNPLDAVWLEGRGPAGEPWRSPTLDFFRPGEAEPALPTGFMFPLPSQWQGPVMLELHARGAMRSALRPRLLHEGQALRRSHVAVAINAAAYAGLFMLALIVLVLYVVARERSFIAAFAAAAASLLFLAAANGHLYQLPGLALLAAWRSQGIWALLLLFCASVLQLLLRYSELRDGRAPAARWFERASMAMVALAALCLLDLPVLRPGMQAVCTLVWVGTALAALAIMLDAIRRHLTLAWSILVLFLVVLFTGLGTEAMQRGYVPDLLWTFYGYQVAMVAALSLLSLSLLSRIGEYRDERDRDQLARLDSERRMHRESTRAALTLALQTRLRGLAVGDIEWSAMRLLLEHLMPAIAVQSATVVARAYHGRDLLLVEPASCQQAMEDDVASRELVLKRIAADGLPLQQPVAGPAGTGHEVLVPLKVRAPGWGVLLLRRDGEHGFSTEEIALAAEFVRLATLHAEEALAAFQLRRSAELDALTGAFNRRSIDQWLARAFTDASRRDEPLSLLFIDIDHFKGINDRLGHAGGDHCLREVAATLRNALDSGDVLGRYGGEEFVAILPGRSGADARALGERLRAAVERSEFGYDGRSERVTVSVGVATRLQRESTPAAAVERADKALYAAKRGGRNCVHVAPAVFA